MKPEGFTAASYVEDVTRCREKAAKLAENYTPPPSNTGGGGGYYGGGGLLGALIAGVVVGVASGVATAAKRDEYEDRRFEACMENDYQQVYLPKSFERRYAKAGYDDEERGEVLAELVESDVFAEFAAWQTVLQKDELSAYKTHAALYPDSLFGNLPASVVAYREKTAARLDKYRRDAFARDTTFFSYGLNQDGWVFKTNNDGELVVDCSVRQFAKARLYIQDGWVQGSMEIDNQPAVQLLGLIEEDGTFSIVGDWPTEDPLVILGEFNEGETLQGLIGSAKSKTCDFGVVRFVLYEPDNGEDPLFAESELLPLEEVTKLASERIAKIERQ
ncbi:hypothetical protein EOI86_01030 [Hwanghaeella grinnelliae]|uniref:Uncharacterized protein n=1 Tax=Hwanghaeella grinnelliae TaxID=2500179 RepID=A0A3S2VNL2_9PROT|nr:hypothetical protein [Hwanghaeella grinnelliae]RVU37918.1 hypothetical protein EOI86_01030 [Hwanghaeella grinnelliae]